MISWFQSFAFKCNLYRYDKAQAVFRINYPPTEGYEKHVVGLYKLSPADPQLESSWCQPLRL
jgi:hypothetical protein